MSGRARHASWSPTTGTTAPAPTSVGGRLLDELAAAMDAYQRTAAAAAAAAEDAAAAARDLSRAQAAYDHWSRGRLT